MCGITGWVSYDTDLTTRQSVISAMTETMTNRGRDAGGVWVRPKVALGHRRLAVIDLPGGRQPMEARTPDGAVALVYSGEVYNFRELRAELVALGRRFLTTSDTEVVLEGYLAWGDRLAEKLAGMYAFAVWDERSDRLVLIRDRMGVKPLYLYPTPDGGLLFGSEPKAILANPAAERIVDTDCLRELIGFTKAPGWSLWKGMTEVEPGTVVTFDTRGLRQRTYWELPTSEHTNDTGTTVETIRGLLRNVVGEQMVSDVLQGVLLSGGLDSSAVTAFAAQTLAGQLRTFSVDFVGQEESFQADEMRTTPDGPFIRDVVAWTNSKHQDVILDPAVLASPELRRSVVAARDMPIGLGDIDSSMYLLFEAIRADSTVALSGEFADELFGGYLWFHHPAARDANTFPWLAFQNSHTTDRTALLQPELRSALDIGTYVADQYAAAVARVAHPDGVTDPLERRMRTSCHLHLTRLARALLDRKDRMSMAVGLEVRVPFADHRLVEYVYNTPWSLKTFDGREKSLLRAAIADQLPESVVNRVKSPYPTPQDPAYGQAVQRQAADVLAETGSPVFDIVDPAWLSAAIAHDPVTLPGATRLGLERVLDLYHWFDLYRPEVRLG